MADPTQSKIKRPKPKRKRKTRRELLDERAERKRRQKGGKKTKTSSTKSYGKNKQSEKKDAALSLQAAEEGRKDRTGKKSSEAPDESLVGNQLRTGLRRHAYNYWMHLVDGHIVVGALFAEDEDEFSKGERWAVLFATLAASLAALIFGAMTKTTDTTGFSFGEFVLLWVIDNLGQFLATFDQEFIKQGPRTVAHVRQATQVALAGLCGISIVLLVVSVCASYERVSGPDGFLQRMTVHWLGTRVLSWIWEIPALLLTYGLKYMFLRPMVDYARRDYAENWGSMESWKDWLIGCKCFESSEKGQDVDSQSPNEGKGGKGASGTQITKSIPL